MLVVGRTGTTGGLKVGLVGRGGLKNIVPGGGLCVPKIENIGGLKVCKVVGTVAGVTAGDCDPGGR